MMEGHVRDGIFLRMTVHVQEGTKKATQCDYNVTLKRELCAKY